MSIITMDRDCIIESVCKQGNDTGKVGIFMPKRGLKYFISAQLGPSLRYRFCLVEIRVDREIKKIQPKPGPARNL